MWIGVSAVVLAVLLHASVPRYEWRTVAVDPFPLIRTDRWLGTAEVGSISAAERETAFRPTWVQLERFSNSDREWMDSRPEAERDELLTGLTRDEKQRLAEI